MTRFTSEAHFYKWLEYLFYLYLQKWSKHVVCNKNCREPNQLQVLSLHPQPLVSFRGAPLHTRFLQAPAENYMCVANVCASPLNIALKISRTLYRMKFRSLPLRSPHPFYHKTSGKMHSHLFNSLWVHLRY